MCQAMSTCAMEHFFSPRQMVLFGAVLENITFPVDIFYGLGNFRCYGKSYQTNIYYKCFFVFTLRGMFPLNVIKCLHVEGFLRLIF